MRQMAYQPMVMGDGIKSFLLTHFREDPKERPEFQMGFAALRRVELIKLADHYGLPLNPEQPKDQMLPQFEIWWNEGKFPVIRPEDETASLKARIAEQDAKLAEQNARMDEMWRRMNGDPAPEGATVIPVSDEQKPPPATEPERAEDGGPELAPSGVIEQIKTLDFNELRKFCKKAGIAYKRDMKRADLIALIEAEHRGADAA